MLQRGVGAVWLSVLEKTEGWARSRIHHLVIRDNDVMHILNEAAQNNVILAFLTLQVLNLATLISPF